MVKEEEEDISKLTIQNPMMYGYFDKKGNIYKIYQPKQKKHKFIKVTSHLQGLDQLKYKNKYLAICASLKGCHVPKEF